MESRAQMPLVGKRSFRKVYVIRFAVSTNVKDKRASNVKQNDETKNIARKTSQLKASGLLEKPQCNRSKILSENN